MSMVADARAFGLVPVVVLEGDDRLAFCLALDRDTLEPVKSPERIYRWEDLKDGDDTVCASVKHINPWMPKRNWHA